MGASADFFVYCFVVERGNLRMKVYAIVACTALVAAVTLALPTEEPQLYEQEAALYDHMSQSLYAQQSELFDSLVEVEADEPKAAPSLYKQQSELFDSLMEVDASKGKKAKKAKKAKKGGKKAKKSSGKAVDAATLKKEESKANVAHGKEIKTASHRHNDQTLAIFKKHKAVTAAEAKANKKQADTIKKDNSAQTKAEKAAEKDVSKASKDATARANHVWKQGVRDVWKIEHPHGKKGLAKEKEDDSFVKKMKAVSQGKAVIAGGDKIYLKKNPGNVPFGKAAKKAAKKAKKAAKKGAKKGAKKAKKVAKKKAKKKVAALYQQQTELFEELVQPRRTAERIAIDHMHDMEELAQAKSDEMYAQALKEPVNVDPVEELMQFDKITPLSEAEEQRGAQRVKLAEEQQLYEDVLAPRRTVEQKAIDEMKDSEREAQNVATQLFQETLGHQRTKEQRATDEMKFAEDVMQDEMTAAFNNALK